MGQHSETILGSDGLPIISIIADEQMGGIAISPIGVWYNHAQLTQIADAIQRARDYLYSQGVN